MQSEALVEITEEFNRRYYNSLVWQDTKYLGVPILKCPMDLWVYQELIYEARPDLIIETGTYMGASALYLLNTMRACGIKGASVITIDIQGHGRRLIDDPRIAFITGDSTSADVLSAVGRFVTAESARTLVVLDSDHSEAHVAKELELYHPLVSVDSYLIVEDTNVNGHPVYPEHGPGPAEAVDKFVKAHGAQFQVNERCERFGLTFNPGGYLRRVW